MLKCQYIKMSKCRNVNLVRSSIWSRFCPISLFLANFSEFRHFGSILANFLILAQFCNLWSLLVNFVIIGQFSSISPFWSICVQVVMYGQFPSISPFWPRQSMHNPQLDYFYKPHQFLKSSSLMTLNP